MDEPKKKTAAFRSKATKRASDAAHETTAALLAPRAMPAAKKAKIREPTSGDRRMDNRPAWLKQLEEVEAAEKQLTDADFEAHLARVGGKPIGSVKVRVRSCVRACVRACWHSRFFACVRA